MPRFLQASVGVQLYLLASVVFASPSLVVPRYGTAEVVLHASQPYNGTQGTPNPFTAVSFQLLVASPTGRVINVDGFFDGDGLGGQIGDVFVARVYADEPGTWTWTSESSDPLLDGQSGSFEVSGTLPGRWSHGAIVVRPATPRHFTHEDATPLFPVGKLLDAAIGGKLGQSFPMLSEAWTDVDRRALLDRGAALSLNKVGVYIANRGDFGGQWPTTPWLGTATNNDKTRFSLARWRMYDQWITQMRDEGLITQLWLFADDSSFGSLSLADRQRLIAYTMARLSAYANTLFVLMLEWEEGWSVADVDFCAQYLQSRNPWRRLHTVHCQPGLFDFSDRGWADYMAIQSGNLAGYPSTHATNLSNRGLAAKPSIDEEFSFGAENLTERQKTWAAFMAGVAGLGTGVAHSSVVTLASELYLERLEPADELALSGEAMVLAERGREYVVYFPAGGTITLDLTEAANMLELRWLNPRDGAWHAPLAVQGGAPVTLGAPTPEDWAAHLRRECLGGKTLGEVVGLAMTQSGVLGWEAVPDSEGYDVVVGDIGALRAAEGLGGSLRRCVERNGADTTALDGDESSPGNGRYYLVRARHCSGTLGTYGNSAAESRDAAAVSSENDCP